MLSIENLSVKEPLMLFASTRNPDYKVSFQEALFQGLSPDSGLFYPLETPDLTDVFQSFHPESDFRDIASAMISSLLGNEIPENDAAALAAKAFPFSPVLRTLEERLHVLELYHGPSSAFKDFGASFLATAMEYFLKSANRKAVILTATSGDTGSAVARAFYGKKNIDVVILYPSGRVSPLQEKQMTTLGQNIHALEVRGSFDDCQKMVKEAFIDRELKAVNLTSANSINLGRLIPQSFYYMWAESRMRKYGDSNVFCVPSGNFGNLTAGLYAKSWGLNVRRFIAATNLNDVVPEYLMTSVYNPRPSVRTYSNAMDVGTPSNFERMQVLYNNSAENMKKDITGIRIDDETTLRTMKDIYDSYGYQICPHTAVGIQAAREYAEQNRDDNITVLSTAHPGKFLEVFQEAVGADPDLPSSLLELKDRNKKSMKIGNTTEDLKKTLLGMY